MSLLEVELETNMRRRLDTLAEKRGLPASVMVRQAVEKLVEDEEAQGKPKHSIMELAREHGTGWMFRTISTRCVTSGTTGYDR